MGRTSRQSGGRRSKHLFVVATEGYRTEPIYFESFNPDPGEGSIRFEILNHRHKNNPSDLLARLVEFREKKKPGSGADYWMVFDKDEWSSEQLDGFCAAARRQKVNIALSNPCFELWLYLHLGDNRPFFTRGEISTALESRLGAYSKDCYDLDTICRGVEDAIRRAKGLDSAPAASWPREQGTWVYRLMEEVQRRSLSS
ncbi:MAG: RloB family protein [Opitutales bacterium]